MKNELYEKKRKVYFKFLLFVLVLFLVVGISYATISFIGMGNKVNSVTTGAITMIYTEGTNRVRMENALPISDEEGRFLMDEGQVFDFNVSINVTGNFSIAYEVVAEKQKQSTLGNQEVKIYLERSSDANYYSSVLEPTHYIPLEKRTIFGSPEGSMVMDTGVVNSSVVYYYRLRMWIDENYQDARNSKDFTVKVNVYGTTEKN